LAMRDDSITQASAFVQHFGNLMSAEQKKTCRAFIGLASHGKAWRMRALYRHDLWKNTLPRRVGQIIRW